MSSHHTFMRRAIDVARQNTRHPFGTVIVETATQEIMAEGVNASDENPMHHGEIVAINNCSAAGVTAWNRLTLYTTAEPCPMCMSAILFSGIGCVVYGTSIPTLKQLGWNQIDIRALDVMEKSHRRDCTIIPRLLEGECDALFQAARTSSDLQ